MSIDWQNGGPGFRRSRFADEGGRVFVVSTGKGALSLEVSNGGTVSLDLHVPFPVNDFAVAGGYKPTPCDYIEGPGCHGTSWYGLASETWNAHGEKASLWTELERLLTEFYAEFEREWAHRRRCSHCSGTGVLS